MYGAYWSNAAKKVQVPSASHLGNPRSALARMPSACCIDFPTAHRGTKKFAIQSYRIVEVLHLRIYYKINFTRIFWPGWPHSIPKLVEVLPRSIVAFNSELLDL